jgi:glycosyltransferase 2 family protein
MSPLRSARKSWRNWFYLGAGTTITVILLFWALRDISLPLVWQSLRQAHWGWLFVGWLAYLSSYWLRAKRWGILLAARGQAGRDRSRLAATFIGFGASSVLPSYVGEIMRGMVLKRLDGIPIEASLGSIVAERLLDLGVVLFLLVLPLWLGALPERSLQGLPLASIGGVILLIWFLCFLAAGWPRSVASWVGQIFKKLGLGRRVQATIERQIYGFLEGLAALRQVQRSLIALGMTLLIWGLNGITYWTGLLAFDITSPGWLGALLVQSCTALAIALPSSPGYIGPFEAGVKFALNLYAIPINVIVGYTLAMRLSMYVMTPIVAWTIATRLGLTLAELNPQKSRTSNPSE